MTSDHSQPAEPPLASARTLAEGGLNFCMLTSFYPPYHFGGDGIAVQRLARGLVRRGHQVTVVHDIDAYDLVRRTASLPSRPRPEAADEVEDGVDVVGLKSPFGALSPIMTQQTGRPVAHGRRLKKLLSAGFDVVNFHNLSLIGGPGLLSVGGGVKLYTAHEHWLVCPTHLLFRHNRERCPERQCARCSLRYRRPPQLWRYTGYLERQLENVDAFIATSEFSRQKHREFGFRRSMEVVPDMLDHEGAEVAVEEEASPHDRPYFLFAGRLERIKGLDDVIPLFDGSIDADLLVAGEGAHGGSLRRLASGNPRVKFLGYVPPGRLPRYYRHAVALIAPSVGYETFGMGLIEAFRYATPVLARRVGPVPEIVERAGGGQVFDGPADLAPAIRRLLSDPARRERLGQAGYRGFRERWAESVVVPRYLEVVGRAARSRGHDRVVHALDAGGPTEQRSVEEGSRGTA